MAQLVISINSTHFYTCGGSIISASSILTAAHCTSSSSASKIMVRVGTKFNSLGGDLSRVVKLINHPSYNPKNSDFDVAVIHLKKPIKLVPRVKEIVKLAAQNEKIDDGTVVFVTGWGDTKKKSE